MRRTLLAVTGILAAAACSSSGGDGTSEVPAAYRGFWNRPNGTIAITLLFEPDAGSRLWQVQCDAVGQGTAGRWVELSDGGLQLPTWNGQPVFRPGDAGTLIATPPMFLLNTSPTETWIQGAVCSVCPLGGGISVVPCADPDGGV